MSEAELHWLRQRLLGGKLTKAEQGELRFRLPVGLVYDPTGKVVLDPDEEVQAAVRLVFVLFHALAGEAPRIKGRTRQVKLEDCPIVLRDAHPGYITWEQFRRHQQMLDDNRTWRPEEHRGAVREGSALLQGIVLCGACGRRMNVRYLSDGTIPSYQCRQAHAQLAEKTCQTMRGDGIDQVVSACFLEAIQPAQLAVALSTLDQLEARARQIERQWQLRLERVQYEADLAHRRYNAVDPDNRLVARSLERDWNAKLTEVEQLQREHAALPKPAALLITPQERERILALAQNVPAAGHA